MCGLCRWTSCPQLGPEDKKISGAPEGAHSGTQRGSDVQLHCGQIDSNKLPTVSCEFQATRSKAAQDPSDEQSLVGRPSQAFRWFPPGHPQFGSQGLGTLAATAAAMGAFEGSSSGMTTWMRASQEGNRSSQYRTLLRRCPGPLA
jgi:hypothetical protein